MWDGVPGLPESLSVRHFGRGERARRTAQNQIECGDDFRKFLKRCDFCCTLYGRGVALDTWPSDATLSRIVVRFSSLQGGRVGLVGSLLEVLERIGQLYGFSCLWSERRARNQWSVSISGTPTGRGCSTGWFGRDVRRYIPGLYWLNYISDEYAVERGVVCEEIAAELGGCTRRLLRGTLVQLYDSPTDWKDHDAAVCRVIDRTPGIFSRREFPIPASLPMGKDRELSRKLSELFP